MKFLKMAILTVGLCCSGAFAGSVDINDWLPWPWGSECPFPWKKIDGDWITRGEFSPERFTFEYKGDLKNGSRVLDIKRFDSEGNLIGVGEGISPRTQRIVRAAMVGVGSDKGRSYWALVRTYSEIQKKTCSSKQVTVITLRGATPDGDVDTHLIVDKEDSVRRKRP